MPSDHTEIRAVHIRVEGRVQGVGYRQWTQTYAQQLLIHGWVKNNDDGSVEVYACADDEKICKFIEGLRRGPAYARVNKVEVEEVPLIPETATLKTGTLETGTLKTGALKSEGTEFRIIR